jgi:type II secretory pathway pseudopilin PulG
VKLVGFIADYDKSFTRSTPPKIMYVVPTQVGAHNLDDSAERDDSVTLEDNDASGLDDMNTPEREHSLPPPPSSASRASVNSSTSEWPQTDFIKKHILDSKLKSAARIVPSPTAIKSSSGGRATSASRGRSTTPNSTRKVRTQDEPPSLAPGIDIYDIEEKTAALEAIQALRAARKQSNSRVHATLGTSDATAAAPVSTYNAEPPILPSPYQRNETTLSELASADVHGDYPYLAAASGARSGPTYSSSSPRTASNGAFFGTPYATSASDAAPTAGAGAQNGSVGANSASLEPTGDFAAFVQRAVDAAVQEKLLNDPAVQQVGAMWPLELLVE